MGKVVNETAVGVLASRVDKITNEEALSIVAISSKNEKARDIAVGRITSKSRLKDIMEKSKFENTWHLAHMLRSNAKI